MPRIVEVTERHFDMPLPPVAEISPRWVATDRAIKEEFGEDVKIVASIVTGDKGIVELFRPNELLPFTSAKIMRVHNMEPYELVFTGIPGRITKCPESSMSPNTTGD